MFVCFFFLTLLRYKTFGEFLQNHRKTKGSYTSFLRKICRKSDECFEKKINGLIFYHQRFFGLRNFAKMRKVENTNKKEYFVTTFPFFG
jgi:hypothetical protein